MGHHWYTSRSMEYCNRPLVDTVKSNGSFLISFCHEIAVKYRSLEVMEMLYVIGRERKLSWQKCLPDQIRDDWSKLTRSFSHRELLPWLWMNIVICFGFSRIQIKFSTRIGRISEFHKMITMNWCSRIQIIWFGRHGSDSYAQPFEREQFDQSLNQGLSWRTEDRWIQNVISSSEKICTRSYHVCRVIA